MDLIPTILPVVTKDLPISPRFTPYDFLSQCKFSTLTTCHQWLNFTYSHSHAFRYERKNKNPTLVRIELTTSAPASVQVTYYTTRATKRENLLDIDMRMGNVRENIIYNHAKKLRYGKDSGEHLPILEMTRPWRL